MERNIGLSRELVTQNKKIVKHGVVELVIQNYSTTKIDVMISNIVTEIPPATKILEIDVPSAPYRINACGNIISEVSVDIVFPTGSGKVIIDCTSTKNC
jgi:hypothetical protein